MLRLKLLLLLLGYTIGISSAQQAYLLTTESPNNFLIHRYDIGHCKSELVCKGAYTIPNLTTNFAIGVDGTFYLGTGNGIFYLLDTASCTLQEIANTQISSKGMGCDNEGNIYFGNTGIYRLNVRALNVDTLVANVRNASDQVGGDFTNFKDEMYWVGGSGKLFKLQGNDYVEIGNTGHNSFCIVACENGCGTDRFYSMDFTKKQVVEIDLQKGIHTAICDLPANLSNAYDAANYYRGPSITCAPTLDLNGNGYGVNFVNRALFEIGNKIALSDSSIQIASFSDIEAVELELPDLLRDATIGMEPVNNWSCQKNAAAKWTIRAHTRASIAEYQSVLSRIYLQASLPIPAGQHLINWTLSDATGYSAKAISEVYQLKTSTAGPDTSLVLCATDLPASMNNLRHPVSDDGGEWYPSPVIQGSGNWYYILPEQNGITDTAVYALTVIGDKKKLLGPDTVLCDGQSLVLKPTFTGDKNIWNNQQEAAAWTVKSTGLYTLVVQKAHCTFKDSIRVDFQSPDTIFQKITTCLGDTIFIQGIPYTDSRTVTITDHQLPDCPDVKSYQLVFQPFLNRQLDTFLCNNTFSYRGRTLQVPGIYADTFTEGRCRVIQRLQLKKYPATIFFPDTIYQCGSEPYELDASAFNAQFYFSSQVQANFLTLPGNGYWEFTLLDAFGCLVEDSLTLADDPFQISQLQPYGPTCAEHTGTLLIPERALLHIDSLSINGQDHTPAYKIPLTKGLYTVNVTSKTGCHYQRTISIQPFKNPDYRILPQELTLPKGAAAQLVIQPLPDTNYQVNWLPEDWMKCASCPSTQLQPGNSGYLYLVITDVNGCVKSDTIRVNRTLDMSVVVPDAFSPNQDGVNDELQLMIPTGDLVLEEFMVFDRWGTLLCSNNTGRWDGRYRNDRTMDPGTYVWVARVKELATSNVGSVTGVVALMH